MPKRIAPLSEIKVRTTKPKEAEYKIFDGGGLFLTVEPVRVLQTTWSSS